jgi:hypothetical protein
MEEVFMGQQGPLDAEKSGHNFSHISVLFPFVQGISGCSHVAYFLVKILVLALCQPWTTSRIVAGESCEPQVVVAASSRFIQTTLATRQHVSQQVLRFRKDSV